MSWKQLQADFKKVLEQQTQQATFLSTLSPTAKKRKRELSWEGTLFLQNMTELKMLLEDEDKHLDNILTLATQVIANPTAENHKLLAEAVAQEKNDLQKKSQLFEIICSGRLEEYFWYALFDMATLALGVYGVNIAVTAIVTGVLSLDIWALLVFSCANILLFTDTTADTLGYMALNYKLKEHIQIEEIEDFVNLLDPCLKLNEDTTTVLPEDSQVYNADVFAAGM